jgi:putative ABC transport system permease protein
MDKDQTIQVARTMNQFLSHSVAEPRFYSLLLGIFAAVALVVAAVGVYGIMSYSVAQRTHEIGVRMALGANHRDVLRLIVGRGMALTIAGIALGLTASLALTQVLSSLLYEVTPTDPTTFIEMTLLLAAVAFGASYIPARRATKVDPMVALRYE